jgi:FOG: HEAT repeat
MQLHRAALAFLGIASSALALGAQAVRKPSAAEIDVYARVMAMTDSRTFDLGLVDSALASKWPPLRAAAALAVGQVGPVHAISGAPRLRSLLADGDTKVASNAAYSLGLLRDSSSIPALSAAINSNAPAAREAAWALGEIGGPARTAIVSALGTPGTDQARMIQLLFAAAKLRPVPVQAIRPYMSMSARPSVLYAASYAIARVRAPSGVRDLIALATEPQFVANSAREAM